MIGIFDSGCGGLTVLKEIMRILPGEKCLYYSDSANCPYGEKPAEFVIARARAITEHLVREGADIIVVACNTATAAAIATLRAEYSDGSNPDTALRANAISGGRRSRIRFIGMEPAVKIAAAVTHSGVVGVLATAGTLHGSKYRLSKERFASGTTIVEHVGQGFVELVESGVTDSFLAGRDVAEGTPADGSRASEGSHGAGSHGGSRAGEGSRKEAEARAVIEASVRPLIEAGADTIVLGCTHYPFLKHTIRSVAEEIASDLGREGGITIIDPAPAVARHLLEVMNEEGLLPSSGQSLPSPTLNEKGLPSPLVGSGSVTLEASGDDTVLRLLYNSIL